MSFGIYILGYIIMIVGLGIGAYLLNIPGQWIAVGATVLIGLGILRAVATTRQRDPSR